LKRKREKRKNWESFEEGGLEPDAEWSGGDVFEADR